MSHRHLIGPFTEIVPLSSVKKEGPLLDRELHVLKDGGIIVKDGLIESIGPFSELKKEGLKIEGVEGESVLIPGLIDAHTHICFAGNRALDYADRLSGATYQEISKRGGGILYTVEKTRNAAEVELVQTMLPRLSKMLSEGITTCEVKSGYGLSEECELKMLRAIQKARDLQPLQIVSTCLAAHTTPKEFASPVLYLEWILQELLPKVKKEKLATRVDIFVEKGAFSPSEAKPFLQRAGELGFDLVVHGDQFSRGGALLAAEVSALSADHLEVSEEEDFRALKNKGVVPIMLPGASFGLGIGLPKARLALDMGLPLVIASDWNPGSAPMGYLLAQSALLGAQQKLSMAETLAAITCRAAHALKFSDRGELSPRKRADFAAYPCSDFREILYWQGGMKPKQVWIKGVARL